MTDKYNSLIELMNNEKGNYNIQTLNRGINIVIIAPHGGDIEPGTSEIAKEIAGEKYTLLLFEGLLPKSNKEILHVTSTHIDFPPWINILKKSAAAISIHGTNNKRLGDKDIEVGGLNKRLISLVETNLKKNRFNIVPPEHSKEAKSFRNIVNFPEEKGCQLEISIGLRASFFGDKLGGRKKRNELFTERNCSSSFYKFADSIKVVLKLYNPKRIREEL